MALIPVDQSRAFAHVAERFRRAGDLDRAVALCREGLDRFPTHVSARVTLGWALLDLGRHDDARAELEAALKRAEAQLKEAAHADPAEFEHLQGLVRFAGVQLALKRRRR